MKGWRVAVVLALAALSAMTAVAQKAPEAKSARGTVTAVTDDSLTVNVHDHSMTFTVDRATQVKATAGDRRTAANQKGGLAPRLSDAFKVGQSVEVSYHDMGSMLHAASVRAVEPAAAPAHRASGTVKTVSGGSLTVTSGGRDQTFVVDTATHITAAGASTVSASVGGKLMITDAVHAGDRVTVTYREDGQRAVEVRVTSRAK